MRGGLRRRERRIGILGLSDDTLRDPREPRWWRGLSGDDAVLLAVWLDGLERLPDELHTDVPVGVELPASLGWEPGWVRRMAERNLARRIDAIVRFGFEWWLLECKPGCDHYCLGQVLGYAFWWESVVRGGELSRVAVVTDRAEDGMVGLYLAYGVEIFEVGEVLSGSARERYRAKRRLG